MLTLSVTNVVKKAIKQAIVPRKRLMISTRDQSKIKEEADYTENASIVVKLDTPRQSVNSCRKAKDKGSRVTQGMRI